MTAALALYLFAAQVQSAGDLPAIERAAESSVQAQPTAANWQRLGLARYMQNHFEQAVPAFRQAIALDANLWPSHLFLGISLYRTNQFQPALASLETARRLAPERAEGSDDIDYWLGATYIALGQPWRGLRSLETLIARNPAHKDALAMLARAYANLSGSIWNNIAEHSFDTPAGLEVHGHALEADGNYVDALAAYRKAQEAKPARPGPGREIGRLLLQQGNTQEAVAALQRERSIAPDDPETAYITALGLMQLGQTAQALPLLEQAYRFAQPGSDVPLVLAQVLLSMKRAAEAVPVAKKALELDPSSAAARDVLAATQSQAR